MRAKQIVFKPIPRYFEAGAPNTPPPKIDGLAVVLLDEVPAAAVLPKADDPKGDDCGVVVVAVAGVCPNENGNAPEPEAGVPLGVVVVVMVVVAGVLVVSFTGNKFLGVVVILLVLVLALGALVVEVDVVEVPFPNTTLLGASVGLLPNTLPPNILGVWVCCVPKGEGLVPVLFENAVVVVFVLLPPNTDFWPWPAEEFVPNSEGPLPEFSENADVVVFVLPPPNTDF